MHEKVSEKSIRNKEAIKKLIKKLHDGEDPQKVKEEFKEVIKNLSSLEIAQAEEQLIKEGMPAEQIHHMCDVHLAVLQETLEEERDLAPEGHPIHILMQEHVILLENVNRLRDIHKEISKKDKFPAIINELTEIEKIVDIIQKSENHYLREENVLFAYLEKYGVTQPPQIMWIEHDRIRDLKKNLFSLIKNKGDHDFPTFLEKFHLYAHGLAEMLASHFPKENKILFPTAMKLLKDSDWVEVRKQFDDIGYFSLSPDVIPEDAKIDETKSVIVDEKQIDLGTGVLDLEILQQIFKTLPVDTTFVDKDDVVKFYSEGPDRVFIRTPSVIGRLVENCHPSQSVDKVMKIIESFKNKTLDKAEFWLELGDRLIFIRYFPVRNKAGEYLGVLEVTQDITDIRKIEGEKRLL
ncbi:MAG: DUF438 domain-containing protein [Candidatus Heimdallarchaeota archaeon]|nr:DUF438 domain-containing protein [Candidatus Heimdallarchaeota archaeon]MCG3256957.1 DUF438 domain-containing protein [Candidatus Heimdallarchaeota archaeon]MCK4612020.1 DUF438 domain-containing protein [Candidatus Heimdallarchaeota archaeon]